jgi:hypothetical protein
MISKVRAMSLVVQRVDRAASKRTWLGDVAGTKAIVFPSGADPTEVVCVVAVAGKLTATGPQTASDAKWGTFIFDAGSGNALASQIGTSGEWPDYFDLLPER